MATRYGLTSKRISSVDIYNATATSMTITSQGNDSKDGYYITAYINGDAQGCAGTTPAISILIKNETLPGWKKISFKTYGTFKSSCWHLNEGSYANNLVSFNIGAGDYFFKCTNCFELPQFTNQSTICDNEPTNAFHSSYAVGEYREWYQRRRRNVLTDVAGPGIYLGCIAYTGISAVISISDIYVSM
jgi:hypothetical protein